MKELSSIEGFVFEGAFKVGFLQNVSPQYLNGFKRNFFDILRIQGLEEELIRELQKPVDEWDNIGTTITPDNAEKVYTFITYLLGYHGGLLYGGDDKNIQLEKFEMGEESSDIVWKNADLVYRKDETLYIVDFKLSGLLSWLKEVFNRGRIENKKLPRLPVVNAGVPINVSLGELDFFSFIKNFLSLKQIFIDLKDVFVEIKGFSQLVCYAVDYLAEKGTQGIKELCLELLYPSSESYRIRFMLSNDTFEFSKYKEQLKEIYISLKSKEWAYGELDETVEKRAGKRERLEKRIKEEIQKYLEDIKQMEAKPVFVQTDPIDEARRDVKEKMGKFFLSGENCKAIALLHSAGSGKTSTLRNLILNSPGNHIVLYMATRISLVEKEKHNVENSGKSVKVIHEKRKASESNLKRHTGEGFEDIENGEGIIKRIVYNVLDAVREGHTQIWGFATIQANVDTFKSHTSKYLDKLLRQNIIKKYHIHIVLDEFLGYRNGFDALHRMFEFLSKVKEKKGKAYLYLFDANGYSPELLERLMHEFKSHRVLPDCLVLCRYKEAIKIQYGGIPFEIYAKHGYPASGLYIKKKFFILDVNEDTTYENKIVGLVGDYITQNLQKESTAFVYMQDKDIIVKLSEYFNKKGISNLYIHSSSKKGQRDINKGSQDVILGTSAVSRGLDFSRPHKPVESIFVVITDWGIEQNLVEVIQAISRARGDEITEKKPKYLHLIYIVKEEDSYTIEKITQLVEYQDEDLVKLFYKKEQLKQKLLLDSVVQGIIEKFLKTPNGSVIVPIPAQHITKYIPNRFSDLENIIKFLDDVYMMESNNQEVVKYIYFLKKEILSGVFVYTNDVPKYLQGLEYYHPYILKRGKLYIGFENENRKNAKFYLEKIKDKLMEHNEDRAREIEEFLNTIAPKEGYETIFLIPIYSWVFTNYVLGKQGDDHLKFKLSGRVGRGGAVVLGASIDITTSCKNIMGQKEYAVIPLGEEYPYREVLSGRFAKFPIEFVHKLFMEE
ncbi:MAG: helicase C-terminal domain-containing protein [Candidatus Micrarchaeaceae archaeon]